MKRLAQVCSWLALAALLGCALLFFAGRLTLDQTQRGLLLATAVWFGTVPFWMEHRARD